MKSFIFTCVLLVAYSQFSSAQWVPLPTGGINNYLTDTHFISPDTGWVVGKGPAILKTTDGGISWISQSTSTYEDILSVYFLDGLNGWVGGYSGSIFKTTDGGLTWSQKFSGFMRPVSQVKFTDQQIGNAVIGNWNGYFRYGVIIHTIDGGENWITKKFVEDYAFIDLDFFDRDNGWAVGTNGLLCRTTNGGATWSDPVSISDFWLHDVHFPDKYIGYTVGGSSSGDIIMKTTNSGNSWTIVRQTNQNPLLAGVYFINIQTGWAVGLNGTILMTTNGGTSWLRQQSGITSLFHDVFMIDSVGYTVGELGKIYKYNSDFQFPLTVIGPNGGEIWYTGQQKPINWIWSDSSNVTIEYSYGTGWILITADHPNNGEYIWTIPSLNTNQALVKISKSSDPGVYDVSDYPFSIRPYIPVELTSFIAKVSQNSVTLEWTTATEINNFGFEVQRSIDNSEFLKIGFVNGYGTSTEPNNYSYIDDNVMPGNYYYRLKQVDFDGTFEYSHNVEVSFVVPTVYKLNQNYPNPFNPSTMITYSIPDAEFVTLKVYDMLGNEIAVLVEGEQDAGTHNVEFNSLGLASGTYFYRIQAGSFADTKKMIVLK